MRIPRVLSRRRCEHLRTRCTHGDEIIERNFCRQVCLDCGKALDRDLPYLCYQTGHPHPSALIDGYEGG